MTDYKEKLDDLHRAARRKARELDEKLGVTGIVEEGARVAGDAAKRGAKTIADGAEHLRAEAGRFADETNLRETAGRASAAATAGIIKAKDWVKENPGKAAAVSFSLILGVRMGASFPGLDAVLLGSHPHWLTHSALPVWGLKKASEKFDEYRKKQEARIAAGELDEAERERVEFQRKMAKYVGAPLLGAFSCAAGAVMFAQIANPAGITGAPISWLLGGNPFLDGVWLFANGVICFHQGYKFFMIALADQEDVKRVVREIKGLLPAA
jgi:hypothetical protein